MVDMFKRLFKKNVKSNTEHIKEVATPCACEGSNEHCDLVLQLRKCQDLKRMISNKIEILDKDNHKLLNDFVNFFYEFENHGLEMGYFKTLTPEKYLRAVEWTIQEYSSADIYRITEELRTYKNKELIIREKQRALKAVEDDIKNIKYKLGIE